MHFRKTPWLQQNIHPSIVISKLVIRINGSRRRYRVKIVG